MGWRSPQTIDIYDQSRDGERTLSVLAAYQQRLSQRRYLSVPLLVAKQKGEQEASAPVCEEPRVPARQEHTIWWHDAETLAWVKKMQQQARETEERGG